MNKTTSLNFSALLSPIPATLRTELVESFQTIESRYREGNWEPSELNGGKFSEVVYTILAGYFAGKYSNKASKPRNMVAACQKFEQFPNSYPRSLRIQIPRMLVALYEIRNNRGVGHAGSDVNPNIMDATCVLATCKWILAELIRVFHSTSVEDAASAVELLSRRDTQLIWEIDGKVRVLAANLSMLEKTLLILYSRNDSVAEQDLVHWLEHSNASVYRRDVLKKAHRSRLIEYDSNARKATISPVGARKAEAIFAT